MGGDTGTDADAIKAKVEELQKVFYDASSKLYEAAAKEAQAQQAAGGEAAGEKKDDFVDADFKEVDEDKK